MPGPKKKKSNNKQPTRNKTIITKDAIQVSCPIVGIGASAGGLVAFKTFFAHMPNDSDMAFVLVPHLDPKHQSLMVELLERQTEMPVCEAQHDMKVESNHVYIIPPAKYMAIVNGNLQLLEPPHPKIIDTAIDHFLRSLADDQEERAIGIIMSGTSSYGTLGLHAIKAKGGMAMVQQPESAEYDSMPQNAIDTGIVDFIMPPEEMPAALVKYVQHAYLTGAWQPFEPAATELEQLDRVLTLLRARTKYDFRCYRKNMVMRRVLRRMSLSHIDHFSSYHEFLRENPSEAQYLLRDLLISVTSFFREPEAYNVLIQRVIPLWIERKDVDIPIRIWVPGCATGEEAYSLAMLLIEELSAAQKPLNVQIFATDIDESALNVARQGLYPVSIAADISPERLGRFFTQSGSHYQVTKQVRDMVVFASQNLISDAPFSRLDLVSCRNLLIYLEPKVQRKVISLFHFSLNENGFLLLGSSETVGQHLDLFETISKKWRVFRRIGPTRHDIVEFPINYSARGLGDMYPMSDIPVKNAINFAELTKRQLLDDYAPASVLINRNYEVLYFQGPTGDFLEPPTGVPTSDLISMARHGLTTKLRVACHRAVLENHPVIDSSSRVKRNGKWYPCTITVKPIIEPNQPEGLLLATFQKNDTNASIVTKDESEILPVEESSLVRQLEYELKETRDHLQSTIEDKESSNEELKSSNEEIMSMNEELQSANEELETSKEELQSLNEELTTVNSQLQDKVEELDKAYSDVTNLLKSADNATLFLDTDLNIRQFTPTTAKLLGLIQSDTGRPISTFASDFTGVDLISDAHQVLETLAVQDKLIPSSHGRYYIRRTHPYRTGDNRIDGLVITFIDITQRIESEQQSQRIASILQDSNNAITMLGLDGKIITWNHGAEKLYGYSEVEALKMNICDLVPLDQKAEMKASLKRIANGEDIRSFASSRQCKDGHIMKVWLTVTPLRDASGEINAISTTEVDLSDWQQLDDLRTQNNRLIEMVERLPVAAVYLEDDRLMMNTAAEKMTGYDRDELTTVDQWFEKLHIERNAEIKKLYKQNRQEGFPAQTAPFPILCNDGKHCIVEYAGYLSDNIEIWIIHDVTLREEYEVALREREERLRAVMDNAAEAIIVIHSDGIISDYNNAAEALFGYTIDEIIGQNVSKLMPSPYREAHDGYLKHYRDTGKSHILNQLREIPGQRKDGTIFPLQQTITQIDNTSAFVGIMRDLSEQKKLERQIADISTQEHERIGREIHDGLGQQLTGLSMMVSSLRRQFDNQKLPELDKLDVIEVELGQAIKDTRALAHGLLPVPVTPDGLSDALTMLAHDVIRKTGIDCHFKAHDVVENKDRTYANQLYRIAQEAVNNAIKHAKPRRINISLDDSTERCELSISDDGVGFDARDESSRGIGIDIMRYRAGTIGFNLEIDSSPEKGTVVRCRETMNLSK